MSGRPEGGAFPEGGGGGRPGPHEIRPLRTAEEFQAAVRLEEGVWGEGFAERVGAMVLESGQRLGGVAAGAFDTGGRLLAVIFGLTGFEDGAPAHWSVLLAVPPALRDTGLGTALKLHQRDELLSRGIRVARWSFDPLQSRNAYLNFAKLGIVVREYVQDMYAHSDSPLHRGIGTDRFVGLWMLDSDRVRGRVEGRLPPPTLADVGHLPRVNPVREEQGLPVSGDPRLGLEGRAVLITIAADIEAVMDRSLERAAAWRSKTRVAFEHYMGRGYEVRELVRDGDVSHYLLEREEP